MLRGPGDTAPVSNATQKQRAYDCLVPDRSGQLRRHLHDQSTLLLQANPCQLRALQMVDFDGKLWVHVVLNGSKQYSSCSVITTLCGDQLLRDVWRVPDKSRLGNNNGVDHNVEVFRSAMKLSGLHYEELPGEGEPAPLFLPGLSSETNQMIHQITEADAGTLSAAVDDLMRWPEEEVFNILQQFAGSNSYVLELERFNECVLQLQARLDGSEVSATFDKLASALQELLSPEGRAVLTGLLDDQHFRGGLSDSSDKLREHQELAVRLRVRAELAKHLPTLRPTLRQLDEEEDDEDLKRAKELSLQGGPKRARSEELPVHLSQLGAKRARYEDGLQVESESWRSRALATAKLLAEHPEADEHRLRKVLKKLLESKSNITEALNAGQSLIKATNCEAARTVLDRYAKLQKLNCELDQLLEPFEKVDESELADIGGGVQADLLAPQAERAGSSNAGPEPMVTNTPSAVSTSLLLLGCTRGLPQVKAEVEAIGALAADHKQVRVVVVDNPSTELAADASSRAAWVHFAGHADPQLNGKRVLAFLKDDGWDAVDAETIVRVLRGKQLVFLNGCKSLELANELAIQGVPNVVCWKTLADDEASKLFATNFWRQLFDAGRVAEDASELRQAVRTAFERGKQGILTVTVPGGHLDGGLSASVPKFTLTDPEDRSQHQGPARRAGVPLLLQPLPEKLLNGVPALPEHYVARPDVELNMRRVLLTDDQCVITASASVAGTAGIGKTTTACWLARDLQVQTHFHDGIVWLVFGNQGSPLEAARELAGVLGVAQDVWKNWSSVREAERELKPLAGSQKVLLVLDDIWKAEHVSCFTRMKFAFVLTTRLREIAQQYGAVLQEMHPLPEPQALSILQRYMGSPESLTDNEDALALVRACSCIPAMLRSVATMSSRLGIRETLHYLQTHKLESKVPKVDGVGDYDYTTMFVALEGNLRFLQEDRPLAAERCIMLAVFPEDCRTPVISLQHLWGCEKAEALEFMDLLKQWHFIELAPPTQEEEDEEEGEDEEEDADPPHRVLLLDLHRDYFLCRAKADLPRWQRLLLDRYLAEDVSDADAETDYSAKDGSCGNLSCYRHLQNIGHHWVGAASRGEQPKLRCLDLQEDAASKIDLRQLANGIVLSTNLCELNLSANDLSKDAREILRAIAQSSALTFVDLSSTSLTSEMDEHLGQIVHQTTCLRELNLDKNKLGQASNLALNLGQNSTLTSLSLEGKSHVQSTVENVGTDGASNIMRAISRSGTRLETLNLAYNNIKLDNVFEELLSSNSSLTKLYLAGNELTELGGQAIGRGLERNATLVEISLNNNPSLGPDGFQGLARAFTSSPTPNKTLRVLNVDSCNIGTASVPHIIGLICSSSGLRSVSLNLNGIEESAAMKELRDAAEAQSTMRVKYEPQVQRRRGNR